MSKLTLMEHVIAYLTLGMLCGIYQLVLVLYPLLVFFMVRYRSIPAGVLFAGLLAITVVPISHKPQFWFLKSRIWKLWLAYFDFTMDVSSIKGKLKKSEKYLFWEAPHGIWPIGQFLSAALIPKITGVDFEDQMICGTAADAVFLFPFVRHVMSWLGTHSVQRKGFAKLFKAGYWGAVVAGGIAEMFLSSQTREGMFIKKRRNTVKMAIQEGAHIIPAFFFGSSRAFHVVGGIDDGKEASYLSKVLSRLSRTLKASIVLFYGRHYLPVPMRTPIKMVSGNIIRLTQCDDPSDEEVQRVLDLVISEFEALYASDKKPAWEGRPLVMT